MDVLGGTGNALIGEAFELIKPLPGGVRPVDGELHVGVPPLQLDLVPLQVVQPEPAGAAQLGLAGAQVDVHLQRDHRNVITCH